MISSIASSLALRASLMFSALGSRVRHRVVGHKALAVLYESKNGLIACPPFDDTFARAFEVHGAWDEAGLRDLSGAVDGATRLLVVGAHLGTLAIPLARKAASCVAIEANPDTFRLLKLNILLNESHNIRALNVAAGESEKRVDFVKSRANTGGSKRAPKHKDWIYYSDSPTIESVEMVALDEALSGEAFDVIVMDIEGGEYFALQGMQRILTDCRHLHIEYLPHHIDRVAGVDDVAFLALVAPHFTSLGVSGEPGRVPRAEFATFVAGVRARGGADLVFSK